jgi:hypothetical protein
LNVNQSNPKPIDDFLATRSARKAGWFGRHAFAVTLIAIMVWLSALLTGMALILHVSNSPGSAGATPLRWPAQSQIPLDATRPTLVMFAHPHCPCTRATLGELELLMARCRDRLSAHVIFIRPAGTAEDWIQTDLWRKASAIPGVTVHADNADVEARNFHAETSGHTALYEPNGRLLFQGGITISRGHSGDNPGRSALVALVEHKLSNQIKTPIFGCSLSEVEVQQGVSECKP